MDKKVLDGLTKIIIIYLALGLENLDKENDYAVTNAKFGYYRLLFYFYGFTLSAGNAFTLKFTHGISLSKGKSLTASEIFDKPYRDFLNNNLLSNDILVRRLL